MGVGLGKGRDYYSLSRPSLHAVLWKDATATELRLGRHELPTRVPTLLGLLPCFVAL